MTDPTVIPDMQTFRVPEATPQHTTASVQPPSAEPTVSTHVTDETLPTHSSSQPPPAPPLVTPPASAPVSLYNMTATDIDGVVHHLSEWAGQVMLIVNLASKCGYTDSNYKGLQATYNKYSRFGFTILGFPCNQFGQQEPGSEAEIKSFCTSTYDVTFPLFSKVDVNGPNAHPLFKNFFKFLVDKDGNVVKRFDQMWTTSVIETEVYRLLQLKAAAAAGTVAVAAAA
ncbi:hypothetical protein QJQ45_020346 [Haematococcus lacustris]|nr:hypothetical protein QJQ45_020346 [Haematococcus lacustris]